jgi:hypothetical protein
MKRREPVILGKPDKEPRIVAQWGYYDDKPIFRIIAWWNSGASDLSTIFEERYKDALGNESWRPCERINQALEKLAKEMFYGDIIMLRKPRMPENAGSETA